jgi:hypothetical protein
MRLRPWLPPRLRTATRSIRRSPSWPPSCRGFQAWGTSTTASTLVQFLIIGTLVNMVDKAGSPFLGMALAFFWAFNVLDAYRQAVLINYGYSQDLGLLDAPQRPRAGQGGLVAGIILTFLGTIAFLDQYVNIDLRWLYDLWPLAIVAVGVWLIVASIRDRQKAKEI